MSNGVRIVSVEMTVDDAKLLREFMESRVASADQTVKFAIQRRYPFDEVGFRRETNLFERLISAVEKSFGGRAA